jgi:hypothetical protein
MPLRVLGENGEPLDAHLDIEGDEVVFHSRGGIRGQPSARNMDYGPGLRLLLRRLRSAGNGLEGVWLDSDDVRHLDLDRRQILNGEELSAEPAEQFRIMSGRMQAFGRPAGAPYGGSRVKRIRLRIARTDGGRSLEDLIGTEPVHEPKDRRRLRAADLAKVTAEHVWNAVQRLRIDRTGHPFGEARDFEVVVDDDLRLAPKAVFGLAASEALGFAVAPADFSGGARSPCHRILRETGFFIVRRGDQAPDFQVPVTENDRVWLEGSPALVVHLRRERGAGLARAKKQSFVRTHGALHCERCGLDPIATFGPEVGEACIEVHHARAQIGDMAAEHQTTLDDLQCLCANCHRIIHALLRRSDRA